MSRQTPEQQVANNVRGHREALGWSQERLGFDVGMSQTTISKLEAAQRPVTLSEVIALAGALMCSPHDLWNSAPIIDRAEPLRLMTLRAEAAERDLERLRRLISEIVDLGTSERAA